MNITNIFRKFGGLSEAEISKMEAEFEALPTAKGKLAELANSLAVHYNTVPRIAVIGKTGVGKSSTINALFSPTPRFRVGHVTATTKKPQELTVDLGPERGALTIIDCPGLGESIQADERYIPLYQDLLKTCDVALWILKADTRDMAEDQRNIRDVLTNEIKERLVIGINQIDLIQPGKWIEEYNVPSKQQEKSIARKVADVKRKFSQVCNIKEDMIVGYAAARNYQTANLCSALLRACPLERAWVIRGRTEVAKYTCPAIDSSETQIDS